MDPQQSTTPIQQFEQATKRWQCVPQPYNEATEDIMKNLRDVGFLIQNIQERKVELDNALNRLLIRGKTCQVRFTVESLIREGDFIVNERDKIFEYGEQLLANELIQSLIQNVKK